MKLDNNNIFCSVSSGYSSIMMAIKMKEWYPNHNIVYAMANTSKEREESLLFMDECDKYYGLNMNWIEAVFNGVGIGVDFNIVKYEDLKRNGEIFEEGIRKFGIPSCMNKWCNRDLKLVPLKKFADSVFGLNNYSIAVGIRIDEIDRVRKDYKECNVFYPLIDHNISKIDRNFFWKNEPIQITIPAYKGNCDLCFEKSNRKLMTIIREDFHLCKWWQDMIEKYGTITIEGKLAYNDILKENGFMTFYRKFNTINDLILMSEKPFYKSTDEYIYENNLFDQEGACGGGCSVF